MNDLNPDEIESVEIIKGPAAATLYGTEASNGVVQIITKKGASGLTPQPAAGTAYHGSGVYGNQLCLPLPDAERINNPNAR